VSWIAFTIALAASARADGPVAPDVNYVLAAVNNEVVTVRDVQLEWRLENRRNANPDRAEPTSRAEQEHYAKSIVIERLWLTHAHGFAMWNDIITRKMVDDEARDIFGSLYADASLPQDEHDLMRAKAESSLARQVAMQFDPEYRRCMIARPSDVRRLWDERPDLHRVPTRVQLGRIVLGRDLHGPDVEAKAAKLRQLAVEKGSLEAAAAELAPGDYSVVPIEDVENDKDMRDDVIAFARQAETGELSAPVVGSASVMLFSLVQREPGREVTFEEAAPKLKEVIQNMRCVIRQQQYFVFNILTESFFGPADLFDDEIEQMAPGTKANRARQNAARPANG
jgi:hypothetical protein